MYAYFRMQEVRRIGLQNDAIQRKLLEKFLQLLWWTIQCQWSDSEVHVLEVMRPLFCNFHPTKETVTMDAMIWRQHLKPRHYLILNINMIWINNQPNLTSLRIARHRSSVSSLFPKPLQWITTGRFNSLAISNWALNAFACTAKSWLFLKDKGKRIVAFFANKARKPSTPPQLS